MRTPPSQRPWRTVPKVPIRPVGGQGAITTCIEFDGATVLKSKSRALQLKLPVAGTPPIWVARSQIGAGADITYLSDTGDHGTVRVPKFIIQKWAAEARSNTLSEARTA